MEAVKLLDVKDLMRLMKIGRDKAYDLMRSEGFPSFRIGNSYRVSEEAYNRWAFENQYRDYAL